MRKKLLWFALMLSVLCVTQATSTVNACYKNAELLGTGDGDMRIETGEEIVWQMKIVVANLGYMGTGVEPWTDVVVRDRLAAELEIDSIDGAEKGPKGSMVPIVPDVTIELSKGKMKQYRLTWDVGTLVVGEYAILYFTVSTKLNPKGWQEYTTPGWYELNSGVVIKFMFASPYTNYKSEQHTEETPPIMIEVLLPD